MVLNLAIKHTWKTWKGGCTGMHTATTRLLKITMCEKSVYFLRLRPPRAIEHPGRHISPRPGLAFQLWPTFNSLHKDNVGLDSSDDFGIGAGSWGGVFFDIFIRSKAVVWYGISQKRGFILLKSHRFLALQRCEWPWLKHLFHISTRFSSLFVDSKTPTKRKKGEHDCTVVLANRIEIQVNAFKYPWTSW